MLALGFEGALVLTHVVPSLLHGLKTTESLTFAITSLLVACVAVADFAAEYLKAALEDADEPRVLLIALRHLAQAQGIAKVAKAAGIERESLYRALSFHGNPRLSTLVAVTKAIGLRLTVEAAQ